MCGEDCCGCEICCSDYHYDDEQICDCGNASSLHTCPFAEEINNDSESLCNCCNDCTHECAQDI
jgi:hypothetical protein